MGAVDEAAARDVVRQFSSPFAGDVSFAAELVFPDRAFASGQLLSPETEYAETIRSSDRRAEFVAGRVAARRALMPLRKGAEHIAIPRTAGGAPQWPAGITGTISHTSSVAAAAVAVADRYAGLGLDLELCSRQISPRVAEHICLPEEIAWAEMEPPLKNKRLLAIFSAKEALYKAVNPEWGVFLAFKDARLRFDPGSGSFRAELLRVRVNKEIRSVPDPVRHLQVFSTEIVFDPIIAGIEPVLVSSCAIGR